MPVHDFFRSFSETDERFTSIDELPDHRTEVEKQFTPIAVYNQEKPDYAFAERYTEEAINVSGAWITLFMKQPRVDQNDLKNVWDEDANPIYSQGRRMKAWFKVDPLNLELTRYGVDSPMKLTVVFARAVLGKEVGIDRLVLPGDVIEAPYNAPRLRGPARFRVTNSYDSGNWHYRWLYHTAVCELMYDDISIRVPHQDNSMIR